MPQSPIILQELKELESSLPAHLHPTGYTVPDGYFDGLAASILQRVKALDAGTPAAELEHLSPFLAGISRKTPYSVPTGYFASLDPSFAYAEDSDSDLELETLSPLLGGLSRKAPFSIPEGYFDQQVTIPTEKHEAPVIQMVPPKKKGWQRFAVAASIVAVIGLGASFWISRNNTGSATEGQSFAWVEKNMKKVSTEDISKFVELAEPASSDMAIASRPDDIKSLLKNVSDKEIQDFLKDVPVDETEDEDILFN